MLTEHAVTRARKTSFHKDGRKFTGVQYGKGSIVGRLYDKALEIATQSHKTWMYDIWNINEGELPDELRVIRVEFQLRREVLKDLALDTVWDLINHPRNLWAYCTHNWLKFTDDPELETRFQETLAFWKTVQEGFMGGQLGEPLIRAKAVNVKKKQIAQQLLGQLTSLVVIDTDEFAPALELDRQLPLVMQSAALIGMDDAAFSERVRLKQGKYLRTVEKFKDAETQRKVLRLPQWIKGKGGVAA
jgi:hypothetical protein